MLLPHLLIVTNHAHYLEMLGGDSDAESGKVSSGDEEDEDDDDDGGTMMSLCVLLMLASVTKNT